MTPSEEFYLKVRNKLDDLGYLQPLSFESVLLVDKIVDDLLDTKKNLKHYKNVAQQSMEACSELQAGVGPYKEENSKLIRENNNLRQKLLRARETVEETNLELRRKIRTLEKERSLQEYLCSQHASKISQLQTSLAQKTSKLMEIKGIKPKTHFTGPYKKRDGVKLDKDQMLEKAQDKIYSLTEEITKLKCEQQELDEVIESLKNKVNCRDSEIERLSALLADGRPLMAPAHNTCPCCDTAPQLLDCRLLAKNKQLTQQLEESKEKQHEAMVRAMELAERNQQLEERRLPSARSDKSSSSKKCCCAENSNKICQLQAKLEDRIQEVERLEHELTDLKKANAEMASDKLSLDKILEITIEDKKRMNDRINELTIIEHDLMLEIERLKRTNAMQKSQLAELEARFTETQREKPTEDRSRPPVTRQPSSKLSSQARGSELRRQPVPTKKVVTKPVVPLPPPKVSRPPPRKPSIRSSVPRPEVRIESSTSSSPVPPPRSPSPDWREQLARERRQCEQQLEDMARQQAEHCAKYHPPPCPRAQPNTSTATSAQQKEPDPQWLLLERVQAERDYYHKEFSRLRDQLSNIPDHSAEASNGPSSPHQKLERLLSERDYYHKEMCRLLESVSRPPDRSALSEMQQQLAEKQDEINVLHGKMADLQHRLALAPTETNSDVLKMISEKEEDVKALSGKIRELEKQISAGSNHVNEDLRRRLNQKEDEILNLRDRLKLSEKSQINQDQQQNLNDFWRKLNLKEEEILTLREKIRDLETNQVPLNFTQTNTELWRRLNMKEDELLRMQERIRSMEQNSSDLTLFKRKYNQKEEENLCLREKIRELEVNQCNSSGITQGAMTRLEMERDAAKGDCVRLREENNALREDMQRLKENQRSDEVRLEQAKKDFDSCVSQFAVERAGLTAETRRVEDELRQCKERLRDAQSEATDQRTHCNQVKMVSEQTERELRTTQDLLQQAEAEVASALDRVAELNEETQRLEWELREARQERTCLKANMAQLDQEKDDLLLKVDEKTEQNVRLEAELKSKDCRIASLEGFIADLQKKLDLALETAARSEQSSRQNTMETDRLRKELDKMERCRDNAVKENSRLQDDLSSLTRDHKQRTLCLESARREVEDLKLQLQGYVAEVRRITDILEEKEAERMAMLEHYRTLTAESANLESNNHSLESEARSTKTCLRDAQNKIQDLEATLGEKQALVQGYEKQLKELTQQVAKLERKVESRTRAESANRDLSRELEGQKHCLAQKVDQLTCENHQLKEEVSGLRSELAHLTEQLGKERRNSATLENVLASSRQETIQRQRDNSELRAQVQCLQGKLHELHEKLEHGSEALRRCQGECDQYQEQVSELRREVTDERFQRARQEEARRSRPTHRLPKQTTFRSRSLSSNQVLDMSPAFVCPCCFLNKISSLRNTPEASHELMEHSFNTSAAQNHLEHRPTSARFSYSQKETVINEAMKICSEISMAVNSSNGNFTDQQSEEFMFPERLVSKRKQYANKFTLNGLNSEDQSLLTIEGNKLLSGTTVNSFDKVEILAEQIDSVLKEQRKFVKELNLPIRDEGGFRLELNQNTQMSAMEELEDGFRMLGKVKHLVNEPHKEKSTLYTSEDRKDRRSSNRRLSKKSLTKTESKRKGKIKKPVFLFNEEPVKLQKSSRWIPLQSGDLNRDYPTDMNLSVKMLFFPENKLHCSSSSIGSHGDSSSVAASSVYVTAANSYSDAYQESISQGVYTVAEFNANTAHKL